MNVVKVVGSRVAAGVDTRTSTIGRPWRPAFVRHWASTATAVLSLSDTTRCVRLLPIHANNKKPHRRFRGWGCQTETGSLRPIAVETVPTSAFPRVDDSGKREQARLSKQSANEVRTAHHVRNLEYVVIRRARIVRRSAARVKSIETYDSSDTRVSAPPASTGDVSHSVTHEWFSDAAANYRISCTHSTVNLSFTVFSSRLEM
jgi:hypothetical protein